MTKGIVPNDVLGISASNIGSVLQPEIQVRLTMNTLKLLFFSFVIYLYFSFRTCQM